MFSKLKLFIEIAENNSVSRAADNVNSTQSTVSAQLKNMETKLGVQLFDRVGRSVRLNKNGVAFLDFARKTLADFENTQRIMQERAHDAGTLTVCAGAHFNHYFLPKILLTLKEKKIPLKIKFITKYSDDLLPEMEEMKYEFAILHVSRRQRSHCLTTDFSYDLPINCVCAPDNPLAQKGIITPADFAPETLINIHGGQDMLKYLKHYFKKHKVTFASEMQIDSVEAIKAAVIKNLGVTFLPQHAAQVEVDEGKLIHIEIPWLKLTRKMICVHHIERPLSSAAQEFIKLAIDVLDKENNFIRSGKF